MNTVDRFTSRAALYHRYRPDYAPEAIQQIIQSTGITPESVIADLGAGTGILTRHFLAHAKTVYAVEPNPEMRAYCEQVCSTYPSFVSVPGVVEATTLPENSVDLVLIGQALHWFEPEPTREELIRILKPGGWLASLFNIGRNKILTEAVGELHNEEFGFRHQTEGKPKPKPPEFYYGGSGYRELQFPHIKTQDWEDFFGGLCSDSHAPERTHPLFGKFEISAKAIFDRFSHESLLVWELITELRLGQLT